MENNAVDAVSTPTETAEYVKAESTTYTWGSVANQIIAYINPQGVESPGIMKKWSWAANRSEDQLSARTISSLNYAFMSEFTRAELMTLFTKIRSGLTASRMVSRIDQPTRDMQDRTTFELCGTLQWIGALLDAS